MLGSGNTLVHWPPCSLAGRVGQVHSTSTPLGPHGLHRIYSGPPLAPSLTPPPHLKLSCGLRVVGMTAGKGLHGCHAACTVSRWLCGSAVSGWSRWTAAVDRPVRAVPASRRAPQGHSPGVWLLHMEHMGVLDTWGRPRMRWGRVQWG